MTKQELVELIQWNEQYIKTINRALKHPSRLAMTYNNTESIVLDDVKIASMLKAQLKKCKAALKQHKENLKKL